MSVFIHRLALCESEHVGEGTRIWAFTHVMSGAHIGQNCNIGDHSFIESGAIIGDRVTLKTYVNVCEGVEIEEDVFVGPGVLFMNDRAPRSQRMGGHTLKRYGKRSDWLLPTRVGRNASLGTGVLVMPGVSIGAFAMVGAGSLVTKNVPAQALVLGSPARQVGIVCVCGLKLNDGTTCESCGAVYCPEDLLVKADS